MRKSIKILIFGVLGLALYGCFEGPTLQAVIRTDPDPPRGPYPLTVTFDGRSSLGPIEQWTWTIFAEWKTEPIIVLSGDIVSYEFNERGKYQVHLEVRAAGRFSRISVEVDVRSQLPEADFTVSPPYEVRVGSTVTFDASSSFDPDGTINTYFWDFGDGTWSSTSAPIVHHTYTEPKMYTVTLVVEDDYGDRSEPRCRSITVRPRGCCG